MIFLYVKEKHYENTILVLKKMGAGLFCFVLCQITILSFWHDSLSCQSHAKQRFQAFRHARLSCESYAKQRFPAFRHDRLSCESHAKQRFFSCGMTNPPFSQFTNQSLRSKRRKTSRKYRKNW